ncbi:hypothetical protein [Haloarcula halophila]|uniref:hypothetical protein n=1 Tax=Haloarcula TaxID=2237 RepID=UPI0023E4761E|nr:hypothetical protein [Halomicroarcula sp. DFY41]
MTDEDLLEPFHLAVIRSVANESDVPEPTLRDALEAHQQTMRDSPGVDELVYEWRKRFDAPVLAQSDSVYIVAVHPGVWEEYGEHLDLEEDVLGAVAAVHQEQTLRDDRVTFEDIDPDAVPLIVARPS